METPFLGEIAGWRRGACIMDGGVPYFTDRVQRTELRRQVEYSLKRNPVTAVLGSAPSVGPSLPARARDVPGLVPGVYAADAKLAGLVEPAQARLPMWDWI